MFFLKLISFCAGCYAAFAGPVLLFSQREVLARAGTVEIAGAGLAVLLYALIYFFFTFYGMRIGRAPRLRWLAALLVAYQMVAGLCVLATSGSLPIMLAVLPLLAVTALLQLAFVWPGDAANGRRLMRRRDPIEPTRRT